LNSAVFTGLVLLALAWFMVLSYGLKELFKIAIAKHFENRRK